VSAILVIQPDTAQAKVLHDVARKIQAELIVVDSSIRALDAIEQQIPDLILVSPLLSPRDEDMLMARLRSLEGAAHVQTVSIPQFSSVKESAPKKKSAFGFGKKKKAAVAVGADPAAFAEEIVTLLNRAAEIHNRPASVVPMVSVAGASIPAAAAEPVWEVDSPVHTEPPAVAGGAEIADSEAEALSMFTAALAAEESHVWESSVAQRYEEPTIVAMSPVESDFSEVSLEESRAVESGGVTEFTSAPDEAEPVLVEFPYPEPTVAEPAPWPSSSLSAPVRSIADEVDELVRQLGLDASFRDLSDDTAPQTETPSDGDSFDFGASLDRARNRSGHAPTVDPVPQVDAEAIRQAAIAEARAAAEREAREASALEIARVLAEAETLRETAIAEARAAAETEAREALAADRLRALAETEQMRESAIAEARAVAEREARDTLAAEVARVRSEAQSTFTDALNKVRVEAEEAERRGVEAERAKAKQRNEEAQEAFARECPKKRAFIMFIRKTAFRRCAKNWRKTS
jgi:hypothetical protein